MKDHSIIWQRSEQMLRYLRGGLSAAEEAELKRWLEEHPEHMELMDQLASEEGFEADLDYISEIDQDGAWMELKNQLGLLPSGGEARRFPLWKKLAGVAAAVAVVTLGVWLYDASLSSRASGDLNDIAPGKNTATLTLASGEVINLSDAKTGVVIDAAKLSYADGEELSISSASGPRRGGPEASSETPQFPGSRTMSVSTPRGGQYQVVLPDGTKVWLNADSKISFPSQFFGKQRKIHLSGEAYFEVAHNKAKPFMVESTGQEVTVLGTHFNINSYADEGSTKTTLLEGAVRISTADQQGVVLKPGQQSVISGSNRIMVKEANTEETMSWKNGYFRFNDEKIEVIMAKLARWYNIEVVYEGKINAGGFTGTVSRNKNISQVLKMLENTKDIHFKIEERRVTVIQ